MQNRPAKNMKSSGQHRPSAPPRAILRLAARAARPQNAGRKNLTIAEKNAPFARPPRAHRGPAGEQRRAKSSLAWGKNAKSFEKIAPSFGAMTQKQ